MTKIILTVSAVVAAAASYAAYSVFRPTAAPSSSLQTVAVASPTSSAGTVFQLQPGESEARFVVDEVLRGSPKTVVGATDQVAGEIAVDPSAAGSPEVGTILINARTLTTDDSQRTRAMQNQILQTSEHEYITFTPLSYVGLPGSLQPGQTYTFDVVGELSIRGVSRPATFAVTLTPLSATELSGQASTTVRYADWGLSIPSVPFVASVAEQVQLQLDFTALAA